MPETEQSQAANATYTRADDSLTVRMPIEWTVPKGRALACIRFNSSLEGSSLRSHKSPEGCKHTSSYVHQLSDGARGLRQMMRQVIKTALRTGVLVTNEQAQRGQSISCDFDLWWAERTSEPKARASARRTLSDLTFRTPTICPPPSSG